MTPPIDLNQVEKRMLWSYHQDGLIDIAIGVGLLAFGLMMLTDNVVLVSIVPAILVPLMLVIKNKVTTPRLGYVQFGRRQKSRISLLFTATLLLGIIMLLGLSTTILSAAAVAFLEDNFMMILGGVMALVMVIAAQQVTTRLYLHALITLVCFWGGSWLSIAPPYFVTTAGSLLLLVGVVTLIRFIQAYPLPEAADDDNT